jgi:hypothetical protein
MQKMGVLFLVCSTLFFNTAPAQANDCAIQALAAAKAAGNNTTTLKQLYNTYFGEPFARHVAGAAWNNPSFDQAAHRERVQTAVLTLAHHLAPYADATFTWKGNIGAFVLITDSGTERGSVKVYPSGKGCMMTDVCIGNKGCLSSYVPKSNLSAQK